MRIKKKVIFLFIATLIAAIALSGCYELGDATENDEEYRSNYSIIRFIGRKGETASFGMKDFYTKEAVNDFASPMSEELRQKYSYIMIKSENSVSLGELAMYFESDVAAEVFVSVFILSEDELPTKLYDGENGEVSEEDCDEPENEAAVTELSFRVTGAEASAKKRWQPMYLKSWAKAGAPKVKRLNIEGGQYIVFRIKNNCSDPALRVFNRAKKEWQEAFDDYTAKEAALKAVSEDPSATADQKVAAKNAFDAAAKAKAVAEVSYNEAVKRYEREKAPEMTEVSFRITAVLINAE